MEYKQKQMGLFTFRMKNIITPKEEIKLIQVTFDHSIFTI